MTKPPGEFPGPGDDREARLTALLCGELRAAEAEELAAELARDPGMRALWDQLAETIGLLRENYEVSAAPARLSQPKREELLGRFKTVSAPGAAGVRSQPVWWRTALPLSLAASVTLLLGFIGLAPRFFRAASNAALPRTEFARLGSGGRQVPGAPAGSPSESDPDRPNLEFVSPIEGRRTESRGVDLFDQSLAGTVPLVDAESAGRGLNRWYDTAPQNGDFVQEESRRPDKLAGMPTTTAATPNAAASPAGQDLRFYVGNDIKPADQRGEARDRSSSVAVGGGVGAGPGPTAPETTVGFAAQRMGTGQSGGFGGYGDGLTAQAGNEDALRPPTSGPVTSDKAGAEIPNGRRIPNGRVPMLGDTPVVGMPFLPSDGEPAGEPAGKAAVRENEEAPAFADALATADFESRAARESKDEIAGGTIAHLDRRASLAAEQAIERVPEAPREWSIRSRGFAVVEKEGFENLSRLSDLQEELEVKKLPALRQPAEKQLAETDLKLSREQLPEQTQLVAGKPPAPAEPAEAKIVELLGQQQQQQPPVEDLAKRLPAPPPAEPLPEIRAVGNPFSTFSLNVADVTFKLAAASLEQGQLPAPGSVRGEEFVNAFDYRDPEPAAGEAVGFVWERARFPFAHNREVIRFALKTAARGRETGRPLNLVLLLDSSGSMERADRVNIVRTALGVLGTQLQPQDRLSVVTFSSVATLRADGATGGEARQALQRATEVPPEGGTNLEDALRLAYETAKRHFLNGGVNRVVVLTDGAANLGNVDPEELKALVEQSRREGVALDAFGVGWEGYNDDLLEVLTRNGDGRYGFINTPEAATTDFAGQLAGALQVAAADVKVQVEFNPARVEAYRQVGYQKHQLTKEQFRDNTVDAAEIGAAEEGNALYVAELKPEGQGPIGYLRVRYRVPATGQYEEREWLLDYSGPAMRLEEAGPALRLATVAGSFAEWLSGSPFAGEVTLDRLQALLRDIPAGYPRDPRPQRLADMLQQARSLSGR